MGQMAQCPRSVCSTERLHSKSVELPDENLANCTIRIQVWSKATRVDANANVLLGFAPRWLRKQPSVTAGRVGSSTAAAILPEHQDGASSRSLVTSGKSFWCGPRCGRLTGATAAGETEAIDTAAWLLVSTHMDAAYAFGVAVGLLGQ